MKGIKYSKGEHLGGGKHCVFFFFKQSQKMSLLQGFRPASPETQGYGSNVFTFLNVEF